MEYTVSAVDEALGLLAIVAAQPGLGVTELAKRSGNTKARSFRLLSTLEGRGFVERHGDAAVYKLGHQALLVGLAAQEQIGLVNQSQKHLRQLVATFNETVHVRVRDGLESVCVAAVESTQDVRVSTHVGKRRDLYAGSSGKVLVAFGPDEVRAQIMSLPLKRLTPTTITQHSKLSRELDLVREQGYATSMAEVSPDIRSVAAPVRDATGEVIATLGISVPANRATEKAMKQFIDALVSQSAKLSRELGFDG